jgi:hypothetical protein
MARTTTARKLLLGLLGGSTSDPTASFTVTTTGAQTLTITGLTVTADTTVDWGDGSSDTYAAGAGARTHNYAGAGTWAMRILQPLNVTVLNVTYPAITVLVNSQSIGKFANMTTFQMYGVSISGQVINSADWRALRPGVFNFGDFAAGAGTGAIDYADFAQWNPSTYVVGYLAAFSGTITMSAANFAGWTNASTVTMAESGLTQAQVNAVLLGLYTAAQSRVATGGSIDLSGTNAAPSGVYAAECPPTTGKAAAFELINDSCGVIAAGKTFTTITVTGGLP